MRKTISRLELFRSTGIEIIDGLRADDFEIIDEPVTATHGCRAH